MNKLLLVSPLGLDFTKPGSSLSFQLNFTKFKNLNMICFTPIFINATLISVKFVWSKQTGSQILFCHCHCQHCRCCCCRCCYCCCWCCFAAAVAITIEGVVGTAKVVGLWMTQVSKSCAPSVYFGPIPEVSLPSGDH